jgi:hypothetical protein
VKTFENQPVSGELLRGSPISPVVRKNSSATCKIQKSQGFFVVLPDPGKLHLAFPIQQLIR